MTPGILRPKILIVRVLEACNAGCFMCSFRWSADKYRYPPSEGARLAQSVAEHRLSLVRFTGGEPLLHQQIGELLVSFSGHGVRTSIISNGALLSAKAKELCDAGLSQIIISLDGIEEHHDRFRKMPGLFKSAVRGLETIKALNPGIKTRVNTVAGPHNYRQLIDLYDLLLQLSVDSWSIIPLKDEYGAWSYGDRSAAEKSHAQFLQHVSSKPFLRILGYGLNWIGRDDDEQENYFTGKKNMTPRNSCRLVDLVRYFVPSEGAYYVCNCLPHRVDKFNTQQKWTKDALTPSGLGDVGQWLSRYGPTTCTGCEPVNAALGELQIDLDSDPFGF